MNFIQLWYIYTDSHSYAHVTSDSFPFVPLFFTRFRMKKWKRLTNSVFLLRCLTQLALCRTVNHECERHYHNHRNNPRFVLQEHTIGEEEWVFKESEPSFRILLLKPLSIFPRYKLGDEKNMRWFEKSISFKKNAENALKTHPHALYQD